MDCDAWSREKAGLGLETGLAPIDCQGRAYSRWTSTHPRVFPQHLLYSTVAVRRPVLAPWYGEIYTVERTL